MGDRGNILVKQRNNKDNDFIYFYGHWSGSEIPQVVQKALAKRWRWNDEGYLARIIFDVMTEDEHGSGTGFGITTYLTDHEYDLLVVDTATQRVYRIPEPGHSSPQSKPVSLEDASASWSFEDYIKLALGEQGWEKLDALPVNT